MQKVPRLVRRFGIPEVRQLATTVDRWRAELARFIDTGHSNAKSEGIKLFVRNAFVFLAF